MDAIEEFRILTQSAPPEYGGTAGSHHQVVTRSGRVNQFHGNLYEFLRNDTLDARNYFSEESGAAEAEPVRRHHGRSGPEEPRDVLRLLRRLPQRPGDHHQRDGAHGGAAARGDFSDLGVPFASTGRRRRAVPRARTPGSAINPVALNSCNMYPLGNVSPSIYRATLVMTGDNVRPGRRHDYINVSSSGKGSTVRSLRLRWRVQRQSNLIRGADVPGFPVARRPHDKNAAFSDNHIFCSSTVNSLRAGYLRHKFLFDQRLNQTRRATWVSVLDFSRPPPRARRFSTSTVTARIGDPITDRDNSRRTHTRSGRYSWTPAPISLKFGGEFRRNRIDPCKGSHPNAFFVFAGTFPTNNAVRQLAPRGAGDVLTGPWRLRRGVAVWDRRLRPG